MTGDMQAVLNELWTTDLEWIEPVRGHEVLYVKSRSQNGVGVMAQVWKLDTRERTEARAKLIAAAPDMFALLQLVCDYQIELAAKGESLPSPIVDAVNEAFSRIRDEPFESH